jgi:2-haloalkanoic acid dehalogenase type II
MAIKAIIFDFWGTLVDEGIYPSLLRQTKYFMGLRDMDFHEFIVKFEQTVMLKKFEDKKDAFVEACNAFEIEPKPFIIDKLIGLWNKTVLLAKPYDETITILEELKKDYKIALLSNNTNFTAEPVIEKFGLKKYFDVVALSYETGLLKTDKKSFDYILKQMKLKKNEVVMVGDSIESDMKAAENAGVRAILADRRSKREYPEKIRTLVELKDLLK